MRESLRIAFANNIPDSSIIELLKGLAKTIEVEDLQRLKNQPELLIFTGGEDVHPSFYKENTGQYTQSRLERDKKEEHAFYSFEDVPKLGICRGSQFLTVMNRGKLVQHVTGHGNNHTIQTKDDEVINVTSTHHQMMYPFNLSKDKYELLAWSQYFKSETYLNGDNVNIAPTREFLEPEVVYYNKTNSLAIQGHPEFSSAEQAFKDYTLELIKEYLFKEVKKPRMGKGLYHSINEVELRSFIADTAMLKARRTGQVLYGSGGMGTSSQRFKVTKDVERVDPITATSIDVNNLIWGINSTQDQRGEAAKKAKEEMIDRLRNSLNKF